MTKIIVTIWCPNLLPIHCSDSWQHVFGTHDCCSLHQRDTQTRCHQPCCPLRLKTPQLGNACCHSTVINNDGTEAWEAAQHPSDTWDVWLMIGHLESLCSAKLKVTNTLALGRCELGQLVVSHINTLNCWCADCQTRPHLRTYWKLHGPNRRRRYVFGKWMNHHQQWPLRHSGKRHCSWGGHCLLHVQWCVLAFTYSK